MVGMLGRTSFVCILTADSFNAFPIRLVPSAPGNQLYQPKNSRSTSRHDRSVNRTPCNHLTSNNNWVFDYFLLPHQPLYSTKIDDTDNINGTEVYEPESGFTEEYFSDFFKELSQVGLTENITVKFPKDITDSSDENDTKKERSSYFIQRQKTVGIGGGDGFVYNVNALKRNLVQEAVRDCKRELLILLRDGRQGETRGEHLTKDVEKKVIFPPRWKRDRDDLIEDRLSALVQANPVSTTTDSNLLDGEWAFAFSTNSASSILDTSRFLLSKAKRINSPPDETDDNSGKASSVRGRPWHFRTGKTENPFRSSTRNIFLENLSEDEDAHIIDETRVFGGAFRIRRRYGVFGLTRTALDLDLVESETKLLGFRVKRKSILDFKGTKLGAPVEVQILYLDTDLCICTTGEGFEGPLHVYTKSDLWVTGGAKRNLRLLARTASWLSSLQSPFRIRQRLMSLIGSESGRPILLDRDLKALNIGELNVNVDGTTVEDPSWDGDDDPFHHLTPSERMEVLKTMSLQDIYRAALDRKIQSQKERKRWRSRNKKKFKGPDL